MKKFSICLVLCLALVICILPQPAEAADLEYYGRSALATLPNAEGLLYAYDRIAAGVEESSAKISVYSNSCQISSGELKTVMDAYRRDYAQHFWLGNSYSYSYSGTVIYSVTPSYLLSGAALETAKAAFEARIDQVLSGITSSMTQAEKALYIHDTLAGMITYTSGSTHAHNAYGALVEGKCVCEGYAEAYQVLLRRVGIQSFLAIGYGNGGAHEWNYVRLGGNYYQTDLTWNDQDTTLYHAYYNLTDSRMLEDHQLDATAYPLPVCSSTEYHYFYGTDAYLDTYTAEQVGQLLKEGGLTAHVYIPGDVNTFISWYGSNISAIIRATGVGSIRSYGYSVSGREVVLTLVSGCAHSNLTLIPEVAATCTADGYRAYYLCSCGIYFADEAATTRISDPEVWKQEDGKLPAAHNYSIAFGYRDAKGHANTCVCGARDTIQSHRPDETGCCILCKWSGKKPVAAVTYGTATNEFYTMEEAIAACRNRCLLKLLDDVSGTYSFSQMMILDLNGHELDGNIIGLEISVMDSQTDDYTVEDAAGYGTITGTTAHLSPIPGYMKITEENGTSFHRVELTVTTVSLRSSAAGMYYTSRFAGDEVVAAHVAQYGVAFRVAAEPTAEDPGICTWYDEFTPGAAGNIARGSLLKGIMKRSHSDRTNEKNAELAVYGRPYLLTTDGTYIFGDGVSRSLRQQVEEIDGMWDSLTQLQKTELLAMYRTFSAVMDLWSIPNLQNAK